MLLCIMSRGRAKNVETVKHIPRQWLEHTLIVTPLSEATEYAQNYKVRVVGQPASVTNYSQKFQWLTYKFMPREEKIVIMDDDIWFNRYEGDRLCVIKDPELNQPLFEFMRDLLDHTPLVGVHPRMMAQAAKGKSHEWNSKIVTIQGINRSLIPNDLILDRHPILADVRLNCELLSRGIATARICTHFVDWLPSQSVGGCDYRTGDMQREATASIAEDFGPYAKQVIKRPKTAKWLGDERYDLNVRWKDLYNAAPRASAVLDKRAVHDTPAEEDGGEEALE